MWLSAIAPYIGENEADKEPFEEWFARVREHIPRVPEDVADQWVHECWGGSPYDSLPVEQLEFEKQSWRLANLDLVRFGESWREQPSDVNRLDDENIRETPLARFMLCKKTWPRPILVLDNPGGLVLRGEKLGRWHLIEGHNRLTYLRCLQSKGFAMPEHDVWVVKAPEKIVEAKDLPVNARGPNSRPTYAHEKLCNAIRYLAISSGSIQSRMQTVLRYSNIERVAREDFPIEMRQRWDLLTHASNQLQSERAAYHFAREVLEFYSWVCMRLGGWYLNDPPEPAETDHGVAQLRAR